MPKYISLLIILFQFAWIPSIYGQDNIFKKSQGGIWLSTEIGFATVEYSDIESNFDLIGFSLNAEFRSFFNEKYKLNIGIEHYNVFGSLYFDSQEHYINSKYLAIPITVIYKSQITNFNQLYAQIGFYGSYLYNSEVKTISNYDGQLTMGGVVKFGLISTINENLAFIAGFKGKSDFISDSRNSEEIILNGLYAVELGIRFAF